VYDRVVAVSAVHDSSVDLIDRIDVGDINRRSEETETEPSAFRLCAFGISKSLSPIVEYSPGSASLYGIML